MEAALSNYRKTEFDQARDELMSQAMRCGVLQATAEQQEEWLTDAMDYLTDQFPQLSAEQLGELKEIGHRFCQPVIPHGKGNTAETAHDLEPLDHDEDVPSVPA
jgi:hypothetical protein